MAAIRNNFSQFTQSYLVNTFSTDSEGVLALENGVVNFNTNLDLSTIGNGKLFLGTLDAPTGGAPGATRSLTFSAPDHANLPADFSAVNARW